VTENPHPKFCVGEEVKVRGTLTSAYDTDRTEVIKAKWRVGVKTRYVGWFYQTAHQPDLTKWWMEPSLHKLPPSERTSWKDCIWQPLKESA